MKAIKTIIRKGASFIAGAAITSIIYWGFLFIFFIATFTFSGQTLNEKENGEAFIFFTSATILFFTFYIIWKYYKKGRGFTAAGIALVSSLAIYSTVKSGQIFFENKNYYTAFDKEVWTSTDLKSFKMAKTLVKGKRLIGMKEPEIIEMLGPIGRPCKNIQVDYMLYTTDYSGWELRLYFTDKKVKKVILYQEGLSL